MPAPITLTGLLANAMIACSKRVQSLAGRMRALLLQGRGRGLAAYPSMSRPCAPSRKYHLLLLHRTPYQTRSRKPLRRHACTPQLETLPPKSVAPAPVTLASSLLMARPGLVFRAHALGPRRRNHKAHARGIKPSLSHLRARAHARAAAACPPLERSPVALPSVDAPTLGVGASPQPSRGAIPLVWPRRGADKS